jgi:uncharacterized damage-inducible protein DinB
MSNKWSLDLNKQRTRVPHISRFVRDVGNATNASRLDREVSTNYSCCISHISPKTGEIWGTGICGRWRMELAEPWLRGTLLDVPVVQRALLHSLQMAQEDTAKWCASLDDHEINARPFQLPSVAFQLRHIARSLDRFCSYAEATPLSQEQFAALASEMDDDGTRESIFRELEASLEKTESRLAAIIRQPLDLPVKIGRKDLPTTLAGLLVHAAEHTQRHVGQAITTAKVIVAQRA